MRYLVCEQQYSEGCDYTIGCGMRFYTIEAKDDDDLIDKIIWPDGKSEYNTLEGERALKRVYITPLDNVKEVALNPYLTDIKTERAERIAKEKENKERAEYERLKSKYE